jgi:hypothetical protein
MGFAVDSSGNQYVVGSLYGANNNFGGVPLSSAGGADLVVAKLNPADPNNPATGTGFWANRFAGSASDENPQPSDQSPTGVAVSGTGTATKVGVIGAFSGGLQVNATTHLAGGASMTGLILATDGDGNGLWGKPVNTQSGALLSIASNPSRDEFVICGYAKGPVTDLGLPGTSGGDSQADILVAKLNATDGTVLWSRQIGGAGTQFCNAVALDSDGTVFASGTYNGTFDLGTGLLPDGGTTTYDSTVLAIWVAKLDATDGHALLSHSYGDINKQTVKAIALDGSHNVAVAGSLRTPVVFSSTLTLDHPGEDADTDGFVAKFKGTDLTTMWARNWGDAANNQEAHGVAFNSAGDVVVVGFLQGTAAGLSTNILTSVGGSDIYWAKFNGTNGTSVCAASYGTTGSQVADFVAISTADGTQKDKVNVVGYASGTFSFGSVTPPFSSTSTKAFMLQLTP